MPLYEYMCETCGDQFEKMISFSAQELKPECPTCHSNETRKQISLFASYSGGGSPSASSAASCGNSASPFR